MRPGEVTDLSSLPVILSVPEVAKILRLSKSQAYEYIQQGVIPCIRLGKSVRVPRGPFLAFLEGRSERQVAVGN